MSRWYVDLWYVEVLGDDGKWRDVGNYHNYEPAYARLLEIEEQYPNAETRIYFG